MSYGPAAEVYRAFRRLRDATTLAERRAALMELNEVHGLSIENIARHAGLSHSAVREIIEGKE